jgi:hypothetical protein
MVRMTPCLAMMVATLLMIVAGTEKKRLEWRPRDGSWWRKLKLWP